MVVLMVESMQETFVGFVYLLALVGCYFLFCVAGGIAQTLDMIGASPLLLFVC